jgi:predicted acyl esterase
VRTPVLIVAGPYNGHNGGVLDFKPNEQGPPAKYPAMLERVGFFARGWSLVSLDLRGYGGSAGCPDWMGPGERADVKAGVEWAASQPWSNGRVALFGLSYEGATGSMALAARPKGLAAVVIGDGMGDAYRWSYSHGVRIHHSVVSPPGYTAYEVLPGTTNDTPDYIARAAATNPACSAANLAGNQLDAEDDPFWLDRRNSQMAAGTDVPLFLSQGLLDDNVRADESVFALWSNATGPKKAWFGQYRHEFPSDSTTGMPGFDHAVFRFLDHHVRGVALADAPTDRDPAVMVGTSDGVWRGEPAWPPADVRMFRTALKTGDYLDSGDNAGTSLTPVAGSGSSPAASTGKGLWTISPPLPHELHLSGLPKLTVDATTLVPGANLVADLYDIDQQGAATLITREAMLLRESGTHELTLHAQDWRIAAGHRAGVLLTPSNHDFWIHRASGTQVTVGAASIDLPLRTVRPAGVLETRAPDRLSQYLAEAPFAVPQDTIAGAEAPFAIPGPLAERPAVADPEPAPGAPTPGAGARPALPRLTVQAGARRRRVTAIGNAPTGARVRVRLLRGRRAVASRTVVARYAAWRATLRAPRRGTYRVEVTTTADGTRLRARSRRVRVR